MRKVLWLLLALGMLMTPAAASAGEVVWSGTKGFEAISKGVFELGFDNMLLVNYDSSEVSAESDDSISTLKAGWIGGIVPRYFVAKNFSVALELNLTLAQTKTTTTIGGEENTNEAFDWTMMPLLSANYYLRLGNSLFFAPGIGVGGFWGKRSLPGESAGTKLESTLAGGAGSIDLGFVYYASANFNLKAGLDIVARFGNVTPVTEDDVEADSLGFTSIDAGVSAGLAYSF